MGQALREFILKYHWKGVLIEPQPDVFERLKANYAGLNDALSFENVAISRDPAPIPMYRLPTKSRSGDHGSHTLATADQKVAAKTLEYKIP